MSVLVTDATALLDGLSDPDFDRVRKILIETVLATDIERHSEVAMQFGKVGAGRKK